MVVRVAADLLKVVVFAADADALLRVRGADILPPCPVPRNTSLNWFMPAFVKRSVGSPCGITGAPGTIRCPLSLKNPRKLSRVSREVMTPRSAS
jgi:hypothetical protein